MTVQQNIGILQQYETLTTTKKQKTHIILDWKM